MLAAHSFVAGELPELVDALQRPTEPLWQQSLRQPHPDQDPVGVLNAQWAAGNTKQAGEKMKDAFKH